MKTQGRRSRGRAVGLLVLAAAFGARSGWGQTPVDPNLFGPGLKALIVAQQDAVRSGDGDTVAIYSRALAMASLQALEKLDPKDEACRRALTSLPSSDRLVRDVPTALLLLRAELSAGEKTDAAELEKEIVATHADSADLRVRLSKTLADGGDLDGAVREATKAAELDPNSEEAEIALGMAWWALNEYGYNEESLRAFAAAQRLDQNGYASNLSLGLIESQYHDFGAAEEHLRAAANAEGSAAAPWYQMGMNAYEQDREAEAKQELEQYLALAKSEGSAKAAQIRLALLTLDAIAEEEGASADPAHRAMEAALREKVGPQTDTMAFSPDAARGAMGAPARETAEQEGDHQSVQATAEQMRELAANSLNDWGTALARKQEYAAAVLPFRYAAEEDPTLDPVMQNLGFSAFMSGGYRESEEALKKVVAMHAEDLTARAWLGMAEFENGESAAAAETFAGLGPALQSKPMMEATAAAAYARAGNRTQAEAALAGVDASDAQTAARAATAALDMGDVERAAALAQTALAGDAQMGEAWRVTGAIDLEKGQGAEAAHAFEEEAKAAADRPEELAEAEALQAAAMMQAGQAAEAAGMRRAALRAEPDAVEKLRGRGELLMKNGDVHGAREMLEAAAALAPEDAELRRERDASIRASTVQTEVH